MAPDLVTSQLGSLPREVLLLDPMMGSGSFVIEAVKDGYECIGIDSDPLAVLITAAAASKTSVEEIRDAGKAVLESPASTIDDLGVDDETRDFIDYWFDPEARDKLARLALGIKASPAETRDILWCAFSRLIITKTKGASRARDVSHSRPHVVRELAAIDPIERFSSSVEDVIRKRAGLSDDQRSRLTLLRGDARQLPLADDSIGAIVTSPPYLTAIDYLRGHRLSLVWMDHALEDLRSLRGENIGSERGAARPDHLDGAFDAAVKGAVPARRERVINRYLVDVDLLVRELARVTVPGGVVTFVVANSNHSGTAVMIDDALSVLGASADLVEADRIQRMLPSQNRYLPPPTSGTATLDLRMRSETILTFRKDQVDGDIVGVRSDNQASSAPIRDAV
jgi:SAM-dependent methyltransferase